MPEFRAHFRLLLASGACLHLASCATTPAGAPGSWHGHTARKVDVWIQSATAVLPAPGWLVKSAGGTPDGFVRYTKWSTGSYEHSDSGAFVVEAQWRPDAEYFGLLRSKGEATEFCTLNPEHGAFMEGDSMVITHRWNHCATLSRRKPNSSANFSGSTSLD